jgi:D-alanyl-D-alanine carboxypeptidase/D-alanyl-D-alanine-endopeptidase (penicillin-binding protein 4)
MGAKKATRFSRKETLNAFYGTAGNATQFPAAGEAIPFTGKSDSHTPIFIKLLADTLKKKIIIADEKAWPQSFRVMHSQPTDTMLSIMMHRSDNFFAEQSLLMVSNERLGYMSDVKMIDTLLKSDYLDMPQKPKWVDGSGLSRYNLVSPRDFVWLLTKMKNEFAWQRITAILPTGGTGTLSNLYKQYAGRIYAKTGSLSNHLALSGYLLTRKGRTLVFSIMVNAEMAPSGNIRKGMEKFLTAIIDKY